MKEKVVIKYDKARAIAEYNVRGDKYFEAVGSMLFCRTNEGLKYTL